MARRFPSILATFACVLACAAWPGIATAGTGGYATHSWPGCGGGFNSGGWDDAGRVYVPCGNPSTIGVYDETATLVQTILVDYFVSDVAPTRDGHYLYLATGGESKRLVRAVDGTYAADPTWAPQQYSLWGSAWTPRGHFVTTDAAGRVYLADGYWSANNTHTVLVYEPTGQLVTRFGEWVEESWTAGHFYWALGGVAVSADGATVYTTEAGNNRVQRWARQVNGSYAPVSSFGGTAANNPTREGFCDYDGWLGAFAAPYDVALDGAGNAYVINTTCKQVLRFAPGFGALQANLDVRLGTGTHPRPHGFAVGRDGTVYVGENQFVLRPAGGTIPATGTPPAPPAPITPIADPAPPAPTTTDPAPPAPTTEQPAPSSPDPVSPPRVDEATPRVMLGVTRVLRTRRGALVRYAARCSERCFVDVRVFERRRVISRRATWLAAARSGAVAVSVPRRARSRMVLIRLRVRDAAGNATTLVRTARV